ncbi:MAG: AI-2E family transporter, partial [Atopostipes sp.]|nr:AI-2E family transporter [Atopostipes sp.]
ASTAVGSIVNFSLAFIFSVYVLLFKEKLIKITKKFIVAHFPKKISEKLLDVGTLTNEAFSGFLKGKLREVFVIIALFSITMKLLNFPYALTISVLIGTLTLIPWFGVFIGFTIGFFLILAIDVKMAFWFLILFVILYQVEGNLIYPIVVGKASGLSSIWIFVAGTLGAQMGGIIGLVLSIPIFSVVYNLIARETNRRLDKKNIDSFDE